VSVRLVICTLVVSLCFPWGIVARPVHQSEPSGSTRRSAGGIALAGRVTFTDGSPAASASLSLRAVGENAFTQRTIAPEDDGRFTFGDLQPGVYHITATAPGYYQSDSDDKLVRPGDSVSITLARGGVITGTVTGVDGAPIVGIPVRADPIRSRPRFSLNMLEPDGQDKTDDRGVYRIFGLEPGEYVVGAGGSDIGQAESSFAEDVRIYYPSAKRQGASTLSIGPGRELTSIDIRYRSERGHNVSGTVAGAFSGKDGFAGALVTLTRVEDGAVEDISIVQNSRSTTFTLKGVADGDYSIAATSGFGLTERTSSEAKRVTVKGTDVNNIVLTLEPSGSVAGQLSIEPVAGEDTPERCGSLKETSPVDVAVAARSIAGSSVLDGSAMQPTEDVPSRRGAFTIKSVRAGTYALDVALDEESLYVASAVIVKPKPESGPTPPPQDASSGVRVAAGEKVSGVAIHLSRGAGSLRGTVESRVAGTPLPAVTVFLVPLDPELVSAALRYRVTAADGKSFGFDHVAPGKYAIVVRETKASSLANPAMRWVTDAELRDSLRTEAKTHVASTVTIGPCQQVVGQVVRFLGTAAARPKVRS
jgi:hypothetical protein